MRVGANLTLPIPTPPTPPINRVKFTIPAQALVVVGGYGRISEDSGYCLSSVLTLLPGSNWTDLAPLPQGLLYASASIMGGRLRVFGGHNEGGFTSEVIIYSHCQDIHRAGYLLAPLSAVLL